MRCPDAVRLDQPIVWQFDLQLGAHRLRLRNRLSGQAIGIRPRLIHLAAVPGGRPTHILDLVGDDAGFHLCVDGRPEASTPIAADLPGEVYTYLLRLSHAPRRILMLAHAAALVVRGVELLLSAASRGGKSTPRPAERQPASTWSIRCRNEPNTVPAMAPAGP